MEAIEEVYTIQEFEVKIGRDNYLVGIKFYICIASGFVLVTG